MRLIQSKNLAIGYCLIRSRQNAFQYKCADGPAQEHSRGLKCAFLSRTQP
jgi:hypothetical protein